jgi:pilus assembly protein CpaB
MKRLIAVALILSLLTGVLFFRYLNQLEQKDGPVMVQVVVAAVDIPAYTAITEKMLKTKSFPEESVHPNAARQPSLVVDLVTESLILADEPVLPAKLKTMGSSSDGLAFAVPAGYRAITIPVDETTGVAWSLRKGDSVDVMADLSDYPFEDKFVSNGHAIIIAAADCEILAIGNPLPAKEEERSRYVSVTLSVTPEQALYIGYALAEGKLRLTLRGINDRSTGPDGPIRLQDVVPQS